MSIIQYRTLDNVNVATGGEMDLSGGTDGDILIYSAGTAVPGGTSTGRLDTLNATTAVNTAAATVTGALSAGTYDFTVSNIGGGAGIFSSISTKDIQLRTIPSRSNTILATVVGNTLELDAGGENISISMEPALFPENLAADWAWISSGTGVTTTSGVYTFYSGDNSVTDVQAVYNTSIAAVSDNNTGQNHIIVRCPVNIPASVANVVSAQWAAEDGATAPRTPITLGVRILRGREPRAGDFREYTRFTAFYPTRSGAVPDGGYGLVLFATDRIASGLGTTIHDLTTNLTIQVFHDITVARFPALTPGDGITFMSLNAAFLNNSLTDTSQVQTAGLVIVKKWSN
jgi:hypothetical protein